MPVFLITLPRVLAAKRGRYGMITFDDGYRDNHATALPILKREGVTATFFVATGFIDAPRLPWWDEIAWMVRTSRQDGLELVANRLIEDLDGEQLLAISYGIGLVTPPMPEQPKKGRMDATYALERHIRKCFEGHLIGLNVEKLGKVIVGAVLADTYDDKKRAQMLARYRVDAKAVRATIAKRMQAEFKLEKQAAMAQARAPKKSTAAPRKKAK